MYEGKPLILVIGASDTGRTPMAAGLLRRALGAGVVVRTAGVLSHEGEGAMPEAQMALEQVGIDISRHLSRPLRQEEHRKAELLLAIDRGTELVLFSEFPHDPRVTCLPVLAEMPDVLDPHRMPLGVWIAALRQLSDQVSAALPKIRQQLGISDQETLPQLPREAERRRSSLAHEPLALGASHKMQWDRDEDMQRLLQLISGEQRSESGDGEPEAPAAVADEQSAAAQAAVQPALATSVGLGHVASQPPALDNDSAPEAEAKVDSFSFHSTTPAVSSLEPVAQSVEPQASAVPGPPTQPGPQALLEGDRGAHVTRMLKLLQAAEELPEVVDWARLRQELSNRLRAIAQLSAGPMDFAPAATLMLEGKLIQQATQPSADGLLMLRRAIKRLEVPLNAAALAAIGGELAEW